MALIKVVTENDIGKGLAIENKKLVAKGIKQIADTWWTYLVSLMNRSIV